MLNTIRDEENDKLKISIIIPCRNEEEYIDKCLNSLIDNNYPKNLIEILVIDGMSKDNTRKIVKEYIERNPFIILLNNPKKITPIAMNIGIKEASGNIIIMVNAHSILDKDFLKYNLEYLKKTGADAVGGKLNTVNDNSSIIAQTIPLAADSPLGSGGKRYRTETKEGWVKDTLPYCAYPKELFNKIGLIDEELIRDQDEEFNYRILKSGGKIYYTPKIISHLQIRPYLKKFWRQYYQYGYFKVRVTQKIGVTYTWRQLVPAIFVSSLMFTGVMSLFTKFFLWLYIFILGLYTIVNFSFSLVISIKKKELKLLPSLIASFITLHFSYGFGYIKGVWDFIVFKKHLKKKIKDMPLTR